MLQSDANTLHLGIYRIFWKDGGMSVAAVGYNAKGDRWFAPSNWIHVPSFDWEKVFAVELITTQRRENERFSGHPLMSKNNYSTEA